MPNSGQLPSQNRIEGALLGLLIGDALGVPYEFHPPEDLPPLESLEFTPPRSFRRAHAGTPPGTWSDDGAQALCLLASLLHRGALDLNDFSRRLINWYDVGYMAVDFRVFDISVTTSEAIHNLKAGRDPAEAGAASEAHSFEAVAKTAVAFGHDTDTTACVAGGITGLIFGVEGIPQRWKNGLRGRELYKPLLEKLLTHVSGEI